MQNNQNRKKYLEYNGFQLNKNTYSKIMLNQIQTLMNDANKIIVWHNENNDQLHDIVDNIDQKVKEISNLVCKEYSKENVKEIKNKIEGMKSIFSKIPSKTRKEINQEKNQEFKYNLPDSQQNVKFNKNIGDFLQIFTVDKFKNLFNFKKRKQSNNHDNSAEIFRYKLSIVKMKPFDIQQAAYQQNNLQRSQNIINSQPNVLDQKARRLITSQRAESSTQQNYGIQSSINSEVRNRTSENKKSQSKISGPGN